jgi:2,4-dienoyl-CoA reductase-like NADH-dependent reductase (Old Yellow Enzyme family)
MSLLFSPIQIRNVVLKNRIVMSPMCQYSAVDGMANDWHLVHLGSRAVGGAGLLIQEATAVTPEGRISPQDLGLWDDAQIAPLKRINDFVRAQDCVPGIQLAHAGRKSSLSQPWTGDRLLSEDEGGWQVAGPTDESFTTGYGKPHPLTKEEIQVVVDAFGAAARRAVAAGYEVIEIHGAHGYLIHEFLSPLCNNRADEYGGNFENRIRFLLQVIRAVRGQMPEGMPLFLRISASDWHEEGWQTEDSVQLAGIVKQEGVDLIDCSSGGIIPGVKIPAGPGYQVAFSDAVRKEGILTGAVGIITTGQQAEDILAAGQADLIFLGRELLRDPYFPMRAAMDLQPDINWPLQYERAKRPVKK